MNTNINHLYVTFDSCVFVDNVLILNDDVPAVLIAMIWYDNNVVD